MFKIISIGDLVVDLIVAIQSLPVEADKHQIVNKFTIEPGGAGNFLIAGSRIGMDMIALGTIGDDSFGNATVKILQEEGINIDGVIQQPDTNSTTVIVLIDESGKHVFLGGYGIGPVIPFPKSWQKKLKGSDAVFSCGYTLQEERLSEAALQSMKFAKNQGIPVFFDPGPEMERATRIQVEQVIAYSNYILLTEEEIPLLTGGLGGINAAQKLLLSGPDIVCVKRGGEGCVIITKDAILSKAGFSVTVRDTTAAGDSFAAAFIYGILNNWGLDDVADFANAMGAAKVRKIGSGRKVPNLTELRAVLKEYQVKVQV